MASYSKRNTLGRGNPVVRNKEKDVPVVESKGVTPKKGSKSGPDMGRTSKNILAAGERLKGESATRGKTAMTRKEAREAAAKRGEKEFTFEGKRYNTRWGGEVAAYKQGTGEAVAKKAAPKAAPKQQVAKAKPAAKDSGGSGFKNYVERKSANPKMPEGNMVARSSRNVKANESGTDRFKREMALPNAVNKDTMAALKALKGAASEDRAIAAKRGPAPNNPAVRRDLVDVVKDSRMKHINSIPSKKDKPKAEKL